MGQEDIGNHVAGAAPPASPWTLTALLELCQLWDQIHFGCDWKRQISLRVSWDEVSNFHFLADLSYGCSNNLGHSSEGGDQLWLTHAPCLQGRGMMTRFPFKNKLWKAKQNSNSVNFICGLKKGTGKKRKTQKNNNSAKEKTMGEMSNICQIKSFIHSSY